MDEPQAAGYAGNFSQESSVGWSLQKSLLHQVQEELKELKGLFSQWLNQHGPPAWLSPYRDLALLYQMLVKKGVTCQVLQNWLANVQALLAGPDKQSPAVKHGALRLLMNAFEVTNLWQREKGGPQKWTFLGPTGVGKTTTIAKLAVHFTLKKKKVGLISLDSMRLGAHEQLAIYGKLIGVPFASVNGRQEFLEALSRLQDLEIILIDTPGQSPSSPDVPVNLPELFGTASALENHLLLSATSSESNLAAAIQGFSVVPLNSIIITKVDESQDFAGLFNQLCRHRVPVSYLTSGQRIPEDIEPASRQRIVALLLEYHQGNGRTAASWDEYEQAVGA
jgi:flagellar biosynthesis protein FlhF